MPNIGKLLITNGKTAQCIAQTTEVVIPKASQFTLNAIEYTNIANATQLQNFI